MMTFELFCGLLFLSMGVFGSSNDTMTTTDGTTEMPDIDLSDYVGRYMNYSILGLNVPLPIGHCVTIYYDSTTFTTTYGMAECSSNGKTVSLTSYTDSTCTSGAEEIGSWTSSQNEFDCSGADRYASMGISIGATCSSTLFTLYAVTGRCFYLGTDDVGYYTGVTCDEESGDIYLWAYDDEDCSEIAGWTKVDECADIDGLEFNGIPLYVYSAGCNIGNDTSESTIATDTSGATKSINSNKRISIVVVTLSALIACFIAAVTII